MKKIIIIAITLFLSLGAFAQERVLATHFAAKYSYESAYGPWQSVNIPVTIDTDKNRIVIYSKETQIIDYVSPEIKEQDGYKYMTAYATDTKYKNIQVELWFMNTTTIVLRLRYLDFEYQYQLSAYSTF